jgi:lysophospholipase L1-like esterase
MQHLIRLDGLMKPEDWGAYHNFYRLRDWPSKYLTNCDGAHPTLHGYKVIANELAKFINNQM